MEVGFALSSETTTPNDLVEHAQQAEQAGFRVVAVSDHFHPWTRRQGQSPMVWPVLGALAVRTGIRIGTAVTCPTLRTHPAVVAHGAATVAAMAEGRFFLGVGSGENLNEHVLGQPWPPPDERLERLAEAVVVMRDLWTGQKVSHHGRYYEVDRARLYTVPAKPPPVYVSAFGPRALEVAARVGDGLVGTSPAPDNVARFDELAGRRLPKLAYDKVLGCGLGAGRRDSAALLQPRRARRDRSGLRVARQTDGQQEGDRDTECGQQADPAGREGLGRGVQGQRPGARGGAQRPRHLLRGRPGKG